MVFKLSPSPDFDFLKETKWKIFFTSHQDKSPIELQEKNTLHRTCARGKFFYRSESYVRDDRGRRLRDWPAHSPSPQDSCG